MEKHEILQLKTTSSQHIIRLKSEIAEMTKLIRSIWASQGDEQNFFNRLRKKNLELLAHEETLRQLIKLRLI